MTIKGVSIGIPICEDIWKPDVVEHLSETGAELLIVINGSPYRWTVLHERLHGAREPHLRPAVPRERWAMVRADAPDAPALESILERWRDPPAARTRAHTPTAHELPS